MTILQALAAFGFTDCTDLSANDCHRDEGTLVRAMTKDGWTYQRFASTNDVSVWAIGRSP